MFTIDRKQENGLTIIYIINNHTQTTVEILPDHGAMLNRFAIKLEGKDFELVNGYKSEEDLNETLPTSYKSAKLSPFPCRIQNGRYSVNSRDFEFANKFNDGSAIHGLLFNSSFEMTDEFMTENNASVTLQHVYDKADEGYPFTYSCTINYRLLINDTLEITTTVKNLGEDKIPVADGWHPYFRIGSKVDDWHIRFNSRKMLEFNEELIPTGQFVDVKEYEEGVVIGDRALDNCFLLEHHDSEQPVCVLSNEHNGLQLYFYVITNYPYLQIFIPEDRESIAIENLSAAPDAFNNHMGISMLRPSQSETFTLRYRPVLNKA